MIEFSSKGDWRKTEKFLTTLGGVNNSAIIRTLSVYGQQGVAALAAATPTGNGDGTTAASWTFKVKVSRGVYSITWSNTNDAGGVPVAILLQYGHGTGTGGYVQGIDYINPAMRPIFDKIAEEVWRVVTSA